MNGDSDAETQQGENDDARRYERKTGRMSGQQEETVQALLDTLASMPLWPPTANTHQGAIDTLAFDAVMQSLETRLIDATPTLQRLYNLSAGQGEQWTHDWMPACLFTGVWKTAPDAYQDGKSELESFLLDLLRTATNASDFWAHDDPTEVLSDAAKYLTEREFSIYQVVRDHPHLTCKEITSYLCDIEGIDLNPQHQYKHLSRLKKLGLIQIGPSGYYELLPEDRCTIEEVELADEIVILARDLPNENHLGLIELKVSSLQESGPWTPTHSTTAHILEIIDEMRAALPPATHWIVDHQNNSSSAPAGHRNTGAIDEEGTKESDGYPDDLIKGATEADFSDVAAYESEKAEYEKLISGEDLLDLALELQEEARTSAYPITYVLKMNKLPQTASEQSMAYERDLPF